MQRWASLRSAHPTRYRLTTVDGTEYVFDSASGELLSVTDTSGNKLTTRDDRIVARNADGEETARLEITRDSQGRITAITAPSGDATTYGYDPEGNLQWVRDRTGRVTTMDYGQEDFSDIDPADPYDVGPHILTSITQYPDAAVPADPATLLASGDGLDIMRVGFNADGTLKGITDASGATADFGYTLNGDAVGLPASQSVESIADANDVPTEIVRDARGNTLRSIQQIDTDTYLVTVYEYDSDDNQTAAYQPFTVGDTGDRFNDAPPATPTRTTYNDFGQPTSVTDPLGNTTTYDYDSRGNPTRITDPLGHVTINTYGGSGGNQLTQTIDALGNVTRYAYDNAGNLTSLTQTKDDGTQITPSTFAYNAQGRLTSTTDVSGGGVTRYFAYDDDGNQTHSWYVWTNPADSADEKTLVSVTAYDEEGRVEASSQYTLTGSFTSEAAMLAAVAASGGPDWSTATTYDPLGRVATTTDRFGHTTTNTYDTRGNVIQTASEVEDELGNAQLLVTRTAYDANGRAVASTDPFITQLDGTRLTPDIDLRTTQTVYDALGRVKQTLRVTGNAALITLIDDPSNPSQKTTGYTELAHTNPAVLSHTETRFDAAGRVYETVSDTGLVTRYQYDAAGRQETVTVDPDNPGSAYHATTTYTYDDAGRQKTVTDPMGRVTKFTYDALGRVTATTQQGDTPADMTDDLITRTEYDALGRRVAEIDALGRRTEYAYDDAGRLTGVPLPELTDAAATGST